MVSRREFRRVQGQVGFCARQRRYKTDFWYSLDRLSSRLKALQKTSTGDVRPTLEFDKDDVDTLDFVTAAANLRAANFKIERKTKFDTKRESLLSVLTSRSGRLTCFS